MLVPLNGGRFAVIDEADAPIVAGFGWQVKKTDAPSLFYAQAMERGQDGKWRMIRLHRLLWRAWGLPPTPTIDHRNNDGLDCRRENLRAATVSQNAANGRRAPGASGARGVQWWPEKGKWTAKITWHGKQRYLGTFDDLESAKAAFEAAASELHGEFYTRRAS